MREARLRPLQVSRARSLVQTRPAFPATHRPRLGLAAQIALRLSWLLIFVLTLQLAELGSHHHDLLIQHNDCPACQLGMLIPDHAVTPGPVLPPVQLFQMYPRCPRHFCHPGYVANSALMATGTRSSRI